MGDEPANEGVEAPQAIMSAGSRIAGNKPSADRAAGAELKAMLERAAACVSFGI